MHAGLFEIFVDVDVLHRSDLLRVCVLDQLVFHLFLLPDIFGTLRDRILVLFDQRRQQLQVRNGSHVFLGLVDDLLQRFSFLQENALLLPLSQQHLLLGLLVVLAFSALLGEFFGALQRRNDFLLDVVQGLHVYLGTALLFDFASTVILQFLRLLFIIEFPDGAPKNSLSRHILFILYLFLEFVLIFVKLVPHERLLQRKWRRQLQDGALLNFSPHLRDLIAYFLVTVLFYLCIALENDSARLLQIKAVPHE